MTKDTQQVEWLEEIAALNVIARVVERHGLSPLQADCVKSLLSDPAILAHVPGCVALREENELISERLKETAAFSARAHKAYEEKSAEFISANSRITDLESQLAALQGGAAFALKVHRGEICYKSTADDQSYGMWCPVTPDAEHGLTEGTKLYTTPQPAIAGKVPELYVIEAAMSESNGRVTHFVGLAKNQDAKLWDCHQIYSDTIKGRSDYEAAQLRHFLGQGPKPFILDFDTDPPASPSAPIAEQVEQDAVRLPVVAEIMNYLRDGGLPKLASHLEEEIANLLSRLHSTEEERAQYLAIVKEAREVVNTGDWIGLVQRAKAAMLATPKAPAESEQS